VRLRTKAEAISFNFSSFSFIGVISRNIPRAEFVDQLFDPDLRRAKHLLVDPLVEILPAINPKLA
jgi:hypothetical protein